MGVADAGLEEEVERAGEQRVADVLVQPGHRTGLDVVHPVAHHELGTVVELSDEAGDLGEVVGEVGVAHDDVLAAGGSEAREVGGAVAPAGLGDHVSAGGGRDLGGAVL